jgi:tetratricopeptide (TPR) repeat protein
MCHNAESPTAWPRRWGFFRQAVSALLLLMGFVLPLVVSGCAGSSTKECLDPSGTAFSAQEDSLGIEEFLALEPAHRQVRRTQAEVWLDRARNAPKASDQVQALANAAGLAPDDPEIWLRLAKIWRWVGENLRTEDCLDNAAAAVRQLGRKGSDLSGRSKGYKGDVALRTGILRAWLHYDRAEYHEGLKWAKAVLKLESGNALALQVQGVLVASLGYHSLAHEIAGDISRARGFHTDSAWILSNLDRSWGRHREAFNYFLNLRPNEDHAAECWRDMGLAAERVGEWSYARRWYRESAAFLPFEDTSCLMEISHDRLDSRSRSSHQPVWLAFGRYFVTGSRSAYTAYALERFDQADSPEEKDHWAGLLVNSAGICIRMNEDKPWALRARGIVFSRTGKEDRGLEDLRRAAAGLKELGLEDGRVQAEIGHLLLIKEQQSQAIRNLRRAVELEEDYAAAWRDLGLALIMAGDRAGAEKALARSLELDATSVTAWYNRGLLNMHAGNYEQAEADLIKAAELAPDNQDVARLLQKVVQKRKTDE